MIRGGTNPPSPPAAPTTPVTPPTLSAGATLATRANVAPDDAPRAAARPRNAMVPTGTRSGLNATTVASTATAAKHAIDTGMGPTRSDSVPPTGRMSTARTTNPAVRAAASAGVRP